MIAFEPDNKNYQLLVRNIKLNQVNNIIIIKKGLYNKTQKLEFYEDNEVTSSIVGTSDSKGRNISKIDVTKLDDELKRLNIERIDFIKMDIEGAEIEAIEGAEKVIKRCHPYFAIASYHKRDKISTCQIIEPMLRKRGYNVITAYPKHLTTYASKRRLY